jgi:hypothetical protein
MFTITVDGIAETNLHTGHGRIRALDGGRAFRSANSIEVQADGDELESVRSQFSNIPMSTGRVVLWTGCTARFIVDNIRL